MACNNAIQAIVILALPIGAQLLPMRARADDVLLEEVRAGNQSAIDSIQTLFCRITKSSPTSQRGSVSPSTAEYWESLGSYRVRSTIEGQYHDSVTHDSTCKVIAKGRNPDGSEFVRFAISRAVPDAHHPQFNVRSLGLLKLCGPKAWPLTLEDLLSRPLKLRDVKRITENGRELISVMSMKLLNGENGDFDIWFDPQVNYLACKLTGTFGGQGDRRRESQVLQFQEVAPGIYFPQHAETRFWTDGKVSHHDVVKFTDVRVNERLPTDVFKLDIPAGADVIDAIQDKQYRVDSSANPVGPVRTLAKFAPPLGGARLTESTEEPKKLTRWIVPASIGILALAACIWIYRKWQAA